MSNSTFSWGRSILAGILATLAFDVVMYLDMAITGNGANIPSMLGSKMIGGEGGLVLGHIGHFVNGIALAIIFAALNPYMPGNNTIAKAVIFSVVETVIGVWMLVLPLLGAGFAGMLEPSGLLWIVTLVRHIGYGLVLGAMLWSGERKAVPAARMAR